MTNLFDLLHPGLLFCKEGVDLARLALVLSGEFRVLALHARDLENEEHLDDQDALHQRLFLVPAYTGILALALPKHLAVCA